MLILVDAKISQKIIFKVTLNKMEKLCVNLYMETIWGTRISTEKDYSI